jgi:uncharacterized protein YndB with AHSA1/START domain
MGTLRIRTYHAFDAPAANVWELLADFGAIERWWPTNEQPAIERVEVDGEGIGMVRRIYNRGAKHPIRERLDRLDPGERTLQLSILSPEPPYAAWYQATGRLVELGRARCRLDYESEFTAAVGRENATRDGILAAYRAMFSGLQSAASS